jgi:hypothetical protein
MDFYNHTRKLFAAGEVNEANLKVMLVGASYTFAATETALTAITSAEVSGNGWTAGGETIANAAITAVGADAKLDGDDISVTATGGEIGPATALVVVDATSSKPLFHYAFPSTQSAGDGTPFNVNWNAAGIATWTAV